MRIDIIMLLLAALVVGACERAPADRVESGNENGNDVAARVASAVESDADFVVYKSPACGCCNGWIEHVREAGYTVEGVDIQDYGELSGKKRAHGVPGDLGSCHTAVIEGYTIEGHVPAESIERLLRERPDIKGLAVPGMPIGSPGMEGPNPERYEVIAFTDDGERRVFDTIEP